MSKRFNRNTARVIAMFVPIFSPAWWEAKAEPLGPPLIEVPFDFDIAACRAPSIMPNSVEEADAEFPCRQMKIVQHWLAALTDPRSFGLEEGALPDATFETFQCLGVGLPEPNPDVSFDPQACQPLLINSDLRRQALFGPTWETQFALTTAAHNGLCDAACVREAVEAFNDTIKSVFNRLFAVLVAASAPFDRRDDLGGDAWWWELPAVYAAETDLVLRRDMMVEDVNAWIQTSGLWVYAPAGTPNNFTDIAFSDGAQHAIGLGDYDFFFASLLHFLYALKDRPDLLHDASIPPLVLKRWTVDEGQFAEAFKNYLKVEPAAWLETAVPYSGQDFARELLSIQVAGPWHIGISETENHVLMTLAHYYLINQWVLSDYRENIQAAVAHLVPEGETVATWYATSGTPLEAALRDALARVIHADMFETNARPYQHHALHPILVLATFAANPIVKAEAEISLHFLATKFTFQSLDGRRTTPMRRNCGYADKLTLYSGDGLALAIGLLTGAYKWNDSPYGFREVLRNPDACFIDRTDCYFDRYTWKHDRDLNDSLGEHIATLRPQGDAPPLNELSDDVIGDQIKNLWVAFSSYRVPRPLHAFLLDRERRHFARMMARYDDDVYRPSRNAHLNDSLDVTGPFENAGEVASAAEAIKPRYFAGDFVYDASPNNERVPEFYFHGPGFVNAAGGTYNPYLFRVENSHLIEKNPYPYQSKCTGADRPADFLKKTENYDNLSRPYMVLPEVPTVPDTLDEDGDGDTTEPLYYRPFGLKSEVVFADSDPATVDLAVHVPMMRGNQYDWFKSVNSSTFKNFSYGYRLRKDGNTIGTYAKLGWHWPIDLPAAWQACVVAVSEFVLEAAPPAGCAAWVPTLEFSFGTVPVIGDHAPAARFRLLDLRKYMDAAGQRGYVLVTAMLRKFLTPFWSTRVARGFWEVVPAEIVAETDGPIAALALVEQRIRDGNNPDWFRLGYGAFQQHFQYRLVTSGEVVRLHQRYGALFDGQISLSEGEIQGIIGVVDQEGNSYDTAQVFQSFMNNNVMNSMPLIDVKSVDEHFRFEREEDDFVYYACSRDGWLYVNNQHDGSWLFVDSRRTLGLPNADPATPYWRAGTFVDDGPWTPKPTCGFGQGGGWNPSPPDNGVTESCSGGEPCPQPSSGRPGRVPGNGPATCVPTLRICLSQSQCPTGQLCLPTADAHDRRCQCPRLPLPDLVPEPAQATQAGGGVTGEGLPGFYFCAPPEADGTLSKGVIVRVRNTGVASAAASKLQVDFVGANSEVALVDPLPPGAAVVRSLPIPESCYSDAGHDCSYEITVDAANDVLEISNGNNWLASFCLQPEG